MEIRQIAQQVAPEGSSLVPSAIIKHLREMNYSEVSINSMLKCGKSMNRFLFKVCNHTFSIVPMTWRCNKRTCKECSKVRSRRILRDYIPFLKMYKNNRTYFYQFLTISPENYDDFEEGLNDIKESLIKFMRRGYNFDYVKGRRIIRERVKDRIGGCFYVIEYKNTGKGWNFHIHIVMYGKWLDYRHRGKCNSCGQNLLKWDKEGKYFYCKSCNSLDVDHKKRNKVQEIWYRASGREARIYGERVRSSYGAVSYLTKYVSIDKGDVKNDYQMAQVIKYTSKRQLINAMGIFHKDRGKIVKGYFICKVCKGKINFIYDSEFYDEYISSLRKGGCCKVDLWEFIVPSQQPP